MLPSRASLASFTARKHQILQQISAGGLDKSPKGSIDAPIVELIEYVNSLPEYVRVLQLATLSQCAVNVLNVLHMSGHNKLLLGSHRVVQITKPACRPRCQG
jgi:hypothetical protein